MAIRYADPIDMQHLEIYNQRLQQVAGDQATPLEGEFWWDVTNHRQRVKDNTAIRTVLNSATTLDQITAPAADVSLNSHKITSLTDPTSAQDAATKAYVDSQAAGVRTTKDAVRLATAAALPTNTRTGNVLTASAVGALTIDGVAVALNDRILVKNEVTGANNGLYTVTVLGTGGVAFQLTRSSDADVSAEVMSGMYTWVEEGTANADTGWLLITTGAITLNTTALSFTQVSGLGQVTAGAGLTKTGNQLDIGAANGILVNADTIQVDPAVVVRKYATTIGDTTTTTFTITHNLNTLDVQVVARLISDGSEEIVQNLATGVNTVSVTFAVAPALNAYRIIVMG